MAKLKAFRAAQGDCLILETGNQRVLIDGGPAGTFEHVLKPYLETLDRLADDQPPVIDLMMVSHIDDDHIAGILDLMANLNDARQAQAPELVEIRSAWHNSFADLVSGAGPSTSPSTQAAELAAAEAADVGSAMTELLDPHESETSRFVLESVAQGRDLRNALIDYGLVANDGFDQGFVTQRSADAFSDGSIRIVVIGPKAEQIDRLRRQWAAALAKIKAAKQKAAAAELPSAKEEARKVDKSVSNLASIVCVVHVDGKGILLTGDARGDLVLTWLEQSGYLQPGSSVDFDVVKLPHHGSDRNVSPEFFHRVRGKHYIVSGNGMHENPEPQALRWLFEARPALDYIVHLTYSPNELRQNADFIDHGRVLLLDAVLQQPERLAVLSWPNGTNWIDINI